MQAVDAVEMFRAELVDRKSEAAVWLAGVVFRDLALRIERIDAQADIEAVPCRARSIEDRAEAGVLTGRVEDDMIRKRADFRQILRLVARAIGGAGEGTARPVPSPASGRPSACSACP
jgi:hypothetical protein